MVDILCPLCNKTKDSTFDFYWSKGERQRRCKDCMKAYSVCWHRERREKVKQIKTAAKLKLAPELGEKDDI